jgi:hypothetical protein
MLSQRKGKDAPWEKIEEKTGRTKLPFGFTLWVTGDGGQVKEVK